MGDHLGNDQFTHGVFDKSNTVEYNPLHFFQFRLLHDFPTKIKNL